jgi:Flp pilus assembly protein TadB
MVPVMSLWLPILLSAVFVFLASSVMHMLFNYHFKDFKKVPDEDKLMEALRGFNTPVGEYFVPYAGSRQVLNSPEYREKMKKGPSFVMSMWESGQAGMAKSLILWFVYSVVVGVFAAYVAGRALGPGAEYLSVFRFAGVTAFCCYTVAHWQDTIWYKRSWGRTLTGAIDGLVYGLLTAGTFGWLWPD